MFYPTTTQQRETRTQSQGRRTTGQPEGLRGFKGHSTIQIITHTSGSNFNDVFGQTVLVGNTGFSGTYLVFCSPASARDDLPDSLRRWRSLLLTLQRSARWHRYRWTKFGAMADMNGLEWRSSAMWSWFVCTGASFGRNRSTTARPPSVEPWREYSLIFRAVARVMSSFVLMALGQRNNGPWLLGLVTKVTSTVACNGGLRTRQPECFKARTKKVLASR